MDDAKIITQMNNNKKIPNIFLLSSSGHTHDKYKNNHVYALH